MAKKDINRRRILWIDLEMTGLNVALDRILELACIVTDWKLNETANLELILKHDQKWLEKTFSDSDFWPKFPETVGGLLEQNRIGIDDLDQFETKLIKFVQTQFKTKRPKSDIILAGNTIRSDRQFVDKYLPRFAEYLHYRMLDVSSFKVYFDARYGKVYPKPDNHRALEDIRGSIEELKYFEKYINVKN